MRKPSRKVIKVYRTLAPRILPSFRHWLSSAMKPKVRRFNFYSRQCNIRYSGAIALTRRRVPLIARLKSIIREFLFVLFPLYVLHFLLSLSFPLSPRFFFFKLHARFRRDPSTYICDIFPCAY